MSCRHLLPWLPRIRVHSMDSDQDVEKVLAFLGSSLCRKLFAVDRARKSRWGSCRSDFVRARTLNRTVSGLGLSGPIGKSDLQRTLTFDVFTTCRVRVSSSTAVGLTLLLFIRTSCAFVVRESFGCGYAALGPLRPFLSLAGKRSRWRADLDQDFRIQCERACRRGDGTWRSCSS